MRSAVISPGAIARGWRLRSVRGVALLLVVLMCSGGSSAYSVLTHEEICRLPGALIAVSGWTGLSYLLGIYFQDFSAYNRGYGSLGVALAFCIWLYWTGFVVLIGAQFNAELMGEARGGLKRERRRAA